MALFERREESVVTVCDRDRVEIRGGSFDGLRGTIYQAKCIISVRSENCTPPRVEAVKHEVKLDGIEGLAYHIDNKYCVLLPSYITSNTNTTQAWGPAVAGGDMRHE
jgi:hypothetical protein